MIRAGSGPTPVALLRWSVVEVGCGKLLKATEMLKNSKLKFFRVLVSAHPTDCFVTNELGQDNTAAAEQASNVHCLIERLHREVK